MLYNWDEPAPGSQTYLQYLRRCLWKKDYLFHLFLKNILIGMDDVGQNFGLTRISELSEVV